MLQSLKRIHIVGVEETEIVAHQKLKSNPSLVFTSFCSVSHPSLSQAASGALCWLFKKIAADFSKIAVLGAPGQKRRLSEFGCFDSLCWKWGFFELGVLELVVLEMGSRGLFASWSACRSFSEGFGQTFSVTTPSGIGAPKTAQM